jgi:glycosyltransferase involved in cell wall biosynthesis
LVPIKDHQTFFEAGARLLAERPELQFVVAGDGELRAPLESSGRRLLGDRVTFMGWVHDLPALYAALDIVVITSQKEGTPVSLIEAGAAARPAVATSVGGVPAVVVDGVTGDLVPAMQPEILAESIGSLLDDPARASSYGAAAREHIRARFTAVRLLDDICSLYEDLLHH